MKYQYFLMFSSQGIPALEQRELHVCCKARGIGEKCDQFGRNRFLKQSLMGFQPCKIHCDSEMMNRCEASILKPKYSAYRGQSTRRRRTALLHVFLLYDTLDNINYVEKCAITFRSRQLKECIKERRGASLLPAPLSRCNDGTFLSRRVYLIGSLLLIMATN